MDDVSISTRIDTPIGLTPLLLLCAFGLAVGTARAQDIAAAEAAHARSDKDAVVTLLLPHWNKGQLTDGRALYLLGNACFFQKHKLQFAFNKAAQCNNRSGRIMWAAADAGSVDAMLDLAVTLGTSAPLRHPDLPQDRTKAYRAALLANAFASTPDQRERAGKLIAEIGPRLAQRLRTRVEAEVARVLERAGIRPPSVAGQLPWIDAAMQRQTHRYVPGKDGVKVGADEEVAESDSGLAPEFDPDSVRRQGDQVQYVLFGMDSVTLVQSPCAQGAPSLIWDGEPMEDGSWRLQPAWRQPIPTDRDYLAYYRDITEAVCAMRPE
jgi:hypothetical protein